MSMTAEQEQHLQSCSCLGRVGDTWLHYRRDGDKFYTATGLEVIAPTDWRDATPAEIIAEMNERGEVPVWGLGEAA